MHRNSRAVLAGLLVALAALGCHRAAPGEASAQPRGPDVIVYVTNHYEISMEIYAEGAGTRHRLGLVNQETSRSFVVPQILVGSGSVEFQAQPTGYGPVIHTESLLLHPGHIVDFEITTNLVGSRAIIRM